MTFFPYPCGVTVTQFTPLLCCHLLSDTHLSFHVHWALTELLHWFKVGF